MNIIDNKLRIIFCLALMSGLSAANVKADNIAFMGTVTGQFGTIDLDTGAFSLLGNSGQTLAGMAVADGMLYASSYHVATGTLFTVNPANGSLTVVGSSSTIDYDDFGSTPQGLYAVGTNTDLYSINAANGVATLIGPTGLSLGAWRSLSNNSNTLYFANGANLYTLNTGTGAATLIGDMGGPEMGAMVEEGGILYAGSDSPSLSVDILNTTTGAATLDHALTGGANAFYGLAPNPLPTPLPAATWLFGSGLGLLGLRRKPATA